MANIKAIETSYKGYRFRSRLEARWAVFMDAIGRQWEYEKEGYRLPSGPYLPDFWLPFEHSSYPDAGYWFEIKPVDPTELEKSLCRELACLTKHTTRMIVGRPCLGEFYTLTWHHAHGLSQEPFRQEWEPDEGDGSYGWETGLGYMWAMSPVEGRCYMEQGFVLKALAAARAARFEHGESGAPRC